MNDTTIMIPDTPTKTMVKTSEFINKFAILWSVFAMGYIIAITFVPIPETSVRFADTVLGFLLGTGVSSIINFFYGSSKSAHNQEEIAQTIATGTNVALEAKHE